jgi:SAM-dependent methyltransferase
VAGTDSRARSFDAIAQTYARARPGYPPAALDWLLPAGARHVLDLGAGTGKLTSSLLERGLEVTAVEPSDQMRAELERELAGRPGLRALAGSAEEIPLADASVDAVLVAQAWHWVDPVRAVPEVARVLVPGGRVGLLWNRRDEREPWVAELSRILVGPESRADAGSPGLGPPFGPSERFDSPRWIEPMTPQGLLDMVSTRSYVIVAEPAAREALLERVHALLRDHLDLAGGEQIDLPYITECVRAELTP